MRSTRLLGPALCLVVLLAAGCTTKATPEPTEAQPEVTATPYGEMLSPVAVEVSSETANTADRAIDGVPRTAWQSAGTGTEWISVDLGDTHRVTRVLACWKPAIRSNPHWPTKYQIQISDDGENWTTLRSLEDADGGVDDFTGLDATGRYVRLYATEVNTEDGILKGYKLFEIEVYGE